MGNRSGPAADAGSGSSRIVIPVMSEISSVSRKGPQHRPYKPRRPLEVIMAKWRNRLSKKTRLGAEKYRRLPTMWTRPRSVRRLMGAVFAERLAHLHALFDVVPIGLVKIDSASIVRPHLKVDFRAP